MSYVEQALLPGETITFRTHLHKIMFVRPAVILLLGIAFLFFSTDAVKALGGLVILVGIVDGIARLIAYTNAEFAVTSRRAIVKVGLLRRRTLEMQANKIETVVVDQSIAGRLFDFGDISIVGSGGTKERFARIASPLEFRRAVQAVSA